MLELHEATGIEHLGSVKWQLTLCLVAVYLICYFSLWKGISTSGKVSWVQIIIRSWTLLMRIRSYYFCCDVLTKQAGLQITYWMSSHIRCCYAVSHA